MGQVKRPQGNGVVLAVLRSRFHRLLSGLVVELRYRGWRSGREYALPVQYARDGDRLVVWPQAGHRAVWWRNFRRPSPVRVRLAGNVLSGTARLLGPGDPGWDGARRRYAERWPRSAARLTGPVVVISLAPAGETSDREREHRDVGAGEQGPHPSAGAGGVAGG